VRDRADKRTAQRPPPRAGQPDARDDECGEEAAADAQRDTLRLRRRAEVSIVCIVAYTLHLAGLESVVRSVAH
jgi:hypothetical protein